MFAAIEHYRQARPVTTPDTGTLLAQLTVINEARATFWPSPARPPSRDCWPTPA